VKPGRSFAVVIVCALVCGLPSAAAGAASPSVTVTDPTGDVTDGRADIVSASSGRDAHSSVFTLRVATPTDPATDSGWDNIETGALWRIDTNYDGEFDFVASVVRVDNQQRAVMLDSDPKIRCFGTPGYDGVSYTATFTSRNCPRLPSYNWRAEMNYDPGSGVVKDVAPEGNPSPPTPEPRTGYWMLGADGKLYRFGNASRFSSAGPFAAAVTARRNGTGVWVVDFFGNVHAYGHATYQGGHPALRSGEFVTTISATPTARGYWLFTSLGRVFPFGDAKTHGDLRNLTLAGPIIASVATRDGNGYYMVGSDGGIFAFGSAKFHGSMGGRRLDGRIVGISPTPGGHGYWLVGEDGGVFAFGDADFRGSMGGKPLWKPMNGLVAFGNGYLMVASDGGVFDFSTKPFLGSLGGQSLSASIIGIAAFST
jgi:hypothetical protein